MPNKIYPMLYIQDMTTDVGLHFNAYDLKRRKVFVGMKKLTDLLDELDTLREEKTKDEG
jgi:hypothetical protein